METSLKRKSVLVVEDVLHRQEIDVRITLSFDRKRGSLNDGDTGQR